MSQLHTLEGQLRAAQDRFKHKKTGLSQMKEDMEVSSWSPFPHSLPMIAPPPCIGCGYNSCIIAQVVRRNLSSLTEDKSALSSTLQEKHNELASQTKQKEELKAKQDRVSLQVSRKNYRHLIYEYG